MTGEEGPGVTRSWLEHVDDESWVDVNPDEIESWVSEDLLKTCASIEPVSEQEYCQIGMIAIVMGDVSTSSNALSTDTLLAARALDERSLQIL